MTPEDHEDYAADLLSSIRTDSPETDALDFIPNPRQTRNAAKAMAVILCRRVTMNSKHRPLLRKNTTYEWKQGVFNCRNIADRGYFWTNFRQRFAGEIHDAAGSQPVAFLLACCEPADTRMNIWAIPEPLLHGALANLPVKESDGDYTVQISTDRQRIEGYAGSPDLAPYYSRFELKGDEMLLLEAARDADVLAKLERKTRSKTRRLLTAAEHELDEAGEFDPKGVVDARAGSIIHRETKGTTRVSPAPVGGLQRAVCYHRVRCGGRSGCSPYRLVQGAGHKSSCQRFTAQDRPPYALRPKTGRCGRGNNDCARFSRSLSHLLREVSRKAN